jgi:RNA polymerase sigma-70 factor (ECF subfamily)
MTDHRDALARRFEPHRARLRAVAYRLLGSLSEADQAIHEAWLRVRNGGLDGVEHVDSYLTATLAGVCLDALRARSQRGDEPSSPLADTARHHVGTDPDDEAALAESVGLTLLVVLDTLTPAERMAFVLHENLGMSFEEIAVILTRSPDATRQLASRARRRIHGTSITQAQNLRLRQNVVSRFLAALRQGDFTAVLGALDPDLVVRTDSGDGAADRAHELRGAQSWLEQAPAYAQQARYLAPALLSGSLGLVLAPAGRLRRALHLTFADDKIMAITVVSDPARLRQLEIALPPDDVRKT